MGLESDAYAAYCFDEVVYAWGLHVENEMNVAANTTKQEEHKAAARHRALMAVLGSDQMRGAFRDPSGG